MYLCIFLIQIVDEVASMLFMKLFLFLVHVPPGYRMVVPCVLIAFCVVTFILRKSS